MFNKKPESLSIEKRYTELGNNYRFFLSWRHALFAGYFLVIGFLLVNSYKGFLTNPKISCFIPLLGFFVSVIFYLIDKRTRDIYHAALNSGKEMEGEKGGFYTSVLKAPSYISHSNAIDFTYIGMGLLLFFLFVGLTIIAFCCSG